MTENERQALITRNMLQFCYTCQKAHECDTQQKCVACFEEHGLLKEEAADTLTTEELLILYAL